MQHLPYGNLDDKHVWPNLTLSGEDIHRAFCVVLPDQTCDWSEIPEIAKQNYNDLAAELNRELDARQAWFEGEDKVTISGVRCRTCNEMLDSEHAEGHACWQKCDSRLDVTLAEYRRSLESQDEQMLKNLVEDYELSSKDENKPSYIDALVEDFKKQLEDK